MREAGEAMGDSRSRNSMAGRREGREGAEGATATWPRRAGSAHTLEAVRRGLRCGTERKEVKIGGVGWIRLAGEIRTWE